MLTEDEAKAKWCPLARTLHFDGKNVSSPHNRVYRADYNVVQSDMPGCNCIASACMAWRTNSNFSEDQTIRAADAPAWEKVGWVVAEQLEGGMVRVQSRMKHSGYCGAFGNPK